MLTPFLIATSNLGKFNEIRNGLEGLPFKFLSLADFSPKLKQVDETGETHEENARQKAAAFFGQTGMMTLGEDSGLEVDALKGELGLHTRRWGAGADVSDEEWLRFFLNRMKDVPLAQRTARFVCCAVFKPASQEEHVFWGETRGTLTFEPQAPFLPGLPLSSVFKPEGFDRVYAALSTQEKNQISHRGLAVGKVRRFLEGGAYTPSSSSSSP